MNQLAIDFNPVRLVRRTDPITSHEAAERVKEFATGHCRLILDALSKFGPMTCDEIAQRVGLLPHQVNKRTATLYQAGKAAPTGEERMSMSGRRERVWRIV